MLTMFQLTPVNRQKIIFQKRGQGTLKFSPACNEICLFVDRVDIYKLLIIVVITMIYMQETKTKRIY